VIARGVARLLDFYLRIWKSHPHARPARRSPLASAPAVLQGPGHRRVPPALGAPPCAQRLLRNGQIAERVSPGTSDLQSCPFADHPNPRLRHGKRARSVPGCGGKTGERTYTWGEDFRVAISLPGKSDPHDWTLSPLPRTLGPFPACRRLPRPGREIFPAAGLY